MRYPFIWAMVSMQAFPWSNSLLLIILADACNRLMPKTVIYWLISIKTLLIQPSLKQDRTPKATQRTAGIVFQLRVLNLI